MRIPYEVLNVSETYAQRAQSCTLKDSTVVERVK